MTQYWAIAVGINQYFNLPPLDYAERDAGALYDFWINKAGFSQAHCHLLTPSAIAQSDSLESPSLTSALLIHTLKQILQQATADDLIWLTFSGYGAQAGGEDYLLFPGSDPKGPTHAAATGDLMTLLENAPAQTLMLLDLKRPDGEADAVLGKSTLAQAQAKDIAAILSCQPDEISQETFTLAQGLFTGAVLESLEENGDTLTQLAQDLTSRLPQMSDRHWRARQTPMICAPAAMASRWLTPKAAAEADVSNDSFETAFADLADALPDVGDDSDGDSNDFETAFAGLADALPDVYSDEGSSGAGVSGNQVGSDNIPTDEERAAVAPASPATSAPQLDLPNVSPPPPRPSVPTAPAPVPQVVPKFPVQGTPRKASAARELDSRAWQRFGLWGTALLALLVAGVIVRNRAALFGEARPRPDISADTAAPATQANRQVNMGILAQAIATLNQERVETPVNQATDFARAIAIAEQIQPGQPVYKRSQRYIRRWANTIVDLAEARAQSGNYAEAIGAARLVPASVEAV
ncbi:MAG: caspase family protein, partial [Cyanobacteria bacterium P01_A01_bin.135]